VGSIASCALSPAALLAAAALLSGCGSGRSGTAAPKPSSPTERQWLDNASRLVAELETDVGLSTSGGADLATARRAMADQSAVYTLLVAYGTFGDCIHELQSTGTPSRRGEAAATLIVSACGRLEHASELFQRAMTRDEPKTLLAATRAAAGAAPLLARARTALARLEAR
jgi:hypothetical protein